MGVQTGNVPISRPNLDICDNWKMIAGKLALQLKRNNYEELDIILDRMSDLLYR